MASLKRDYFLLAVLAAFALSFPLVDDNLYHYRVVGLIGIYSILAVGLNLVMGYAGQISLGHAAFFGIGAYATAILVSDQPLLQNWLTSLPRQGFTGQVIQGMKNSDSSLLHFLCDGYFKNLDFAVELSGAVHGLTSNHFALAPLFAAAFTGLVALLIGAPTLRLRGHYLAMATLGIGIIIDIVFKEEKALTGASDGLQVPALIIGGFEFRHTHVNFYYLIWAVTLMVVLLSIHLVHSRQGRALRSIHADEIAAAASGVPVWKMKVMVFTLAAVFASFAGSLFAHYQTLVAPTPFGFNWSVKLVIMVVIGGMGSIWGAVLGAALIICLPEFLTKLEDYEMAIFGLILILIMMVSPKGLAGIMNSMAQRLRRAAPGEV